MDYWHHGTESQESWDDPGNEYKAYAQNYGSHGQDYGEQTTAYGSWGEDSKELMFFLFFFSSSPFTISIPCRTGSTMMMTTMPVHGTMTVPLRTGWLMNIFFEV